MPTLAAGNKTPCRARGPGRLHAASRGRCTPHRPAAIAEAAAPGRPRYRQRGFTVLELLLVLVLMLLATAGVSLALRDGAELRLERDAQRLSALLNAAQARSQATGVPVRWLATAQGFRFEGLGTSAPELAASQRWLDPDTTVLAPAPVLLLGPEPVLPPQALRLGSRALPGRTLRLTSDGLRPFILQVAP